MSGITQDYLGTSSAKLGRLTESDVNERWLSDVLSQDNPGTKVARLTRTGGHRGASVKIYATLEYETNPFQLPAELVIKGSFGRHGQLFDFIYWTEMRAYRAILPTLDVLRPRSYFAGLEPLHRHPIVVMENLAPQKVRFNNVLVPYTFEQMSRALESMAAYHARWWNSEALLDDSRFGFIDYDSSDAFFEYVSHVLQPDVWKAYLRLPRGGTVPRAFQDHNRIELAMQNLREFHKISPICTVHGDCHFGNSYLTSDGRTGWVDWNIKKSPWYKDFTFFLVSGLDSLDRHNWERALLTHYLGALAASGVVAPQFEEAWLSYRREIVHGLLIWITNGDDQGELQSEPTNTGNTARFVSAAIDHSTLELLT
jgi:hypothetical protein